jgi:hypothetical protein
MYLKTLAYFFIAACALNGGKGKVTKFTASVVVNADLIVVYETPVPPGQIKQRRSDERR